MTKRFLSGRPLPRRTLLGAAAALTVFPASGLAASLPEETHDVVVVGSGFAGLAAALEARRAGADVLILEKMPGLGGNSVLSAGDMAVPASPVQKACGIEGDSPEVMLADLVHFGGATSMSHARALVANALETWELTRERLGVPWNLARIQGDWGQSVPRGITLVTRSGLTIVEAAVELLKRRQTDIRTGHRMERLILDESTGRAAGVTATDLSTGQQTRFLARTGVVLAYGGFSADVAFRSALNPLLGRNVATSNQPGATSEAWRALIDAGASMLDLKEIQVMGWNSADERGLGEAWTVIEYATVPHGNWVRNRTGETLLNGDRSPRFRADLLLRLCSAGERVTAVVSDEGLARAHADARLIDGLVTRGIIRRYPTWSRLAEGEGIRAAVNDPPGSGGAWHAVSLVPKVHHCQGGLEIDGRARVRADRGPAKGGVIPGLFAAGECTGGLFGKARLPSHSVTDALVMGRIAGLEAVKG
ncbi:FAD-dependent oxidoreductase [Sutterella sp.]|uniref:FAD-dependent oxidoreductase n=1 Tax=Sutterella sp. TaxID=1981025 RepID=UPI0026E075B3|nr:FAD-dependent oxidoreductase [Sutterella sp.]MDO5531683.1 FAD-dependent oxidoreductase [Sutterella sp.]